MIANRRIYAMWWSKITRHDERLAQRLREDALRHRPEFSESLHRRICESIEWTHTTSTPAVDDTLPRPIQRSRWLTVALAASLLLAVLVRWQTSRTAPVAQLPVAAPVDPRVTEEARPAVAPPPGSSPTEHTVDPLLAGETTEIAPATLVADAGGMLARIDRTLASSQWAFLEHDARVTWQFVTHVLPVSAAPESSKDW
jgi:hypothetical protein